MLVKPLCHALGKDMKKNVTTTGIRLCILPASLFRAFLTYFMHVSHGFHTQTDTIQIFFYQYQTG